MSNVPTGVQKRWLRAADELDVHADDLTEQATRARNAAAELRRGFAPVAEAPKAKRRHKVRTDAPKTNGGDPEAPYGRKADGTPRKRPGRQPTAVAA